LSPHLLCQRREANFKAKKEHLYPFNQSDKYSRIVFLGSALRRGPMLTRHDALAPSTARERGTGRGCRVRAQRSSSWVDARHTFGVIDCGFLVERYESSYGGSCEPSPRLRVGNGRSLSFLLGRTMTDQCPDQEGKLHRHRRRWRGN
jgi:hypothetical protein